MTSRRNFLLGLGAALAAPAIIRTPGLLMPVRKVIKPEHELAVLWEEMVETEGYESIFRTSIPGSAWIKFAEINMPARLLFSEARA